MGCICTFGCVPLTASFRATYFILSLLVNQIISFWYYIHIYRFYFMIMIMIQLNQTILISIQMKN